MTDPDILPTDLKFRFQLGKTLPATITIHNPSSDKLAFKGTVDPKATASIQVVMQAQKELPADYTNCKDKFLVQTVHISADEEINADTFRKDARKDVKEAKLKVILEGPAAPPSPVPEENEEDARSETREQKSLGVAPRAMPAAERSVLTATTSSDAMPKQFEAVKVQLEKIRGERDELKKKLDMIELQKAGVNVGGPSSGAVKTAKGSSTYMISIVQLLLVAIIAFLIGHYL